MLISYNWLKTFIELPESPEVVADILTSLGFETTPRAANRGFKNIVVGKVISKNPHPSAQKLSICEVSTTGDSGAGKVHKVVCGAPNVAVGQIVPLALPGSSVGDTILKKTEIRGVISEGMICSEKELGLSETSDGIMTLSNDARPGMDFSSIYQADTILEVETLPNRPDILSHYGVALELSSRFPGRTVLIPPVYNDNIPEGTGSWVEVLPPLTLINPSIKNLSHKKNIPDCPLYIAISISGISLSGHPTPEWMKNRLRLCGLRPINTPTDIVNYILMEIGHPLHAFDGKRLLTSYGASEKIFVRYGLAAEKILALDGRTYEVSPDDIVISAGRSPVNSRPAAIAGIIGGEETAVKDDTSSVILESAVFNPARIFSTRRRLNVSTESSYRFERGMSKRRAILAARRACYLFREILGKDIKFESYFESGSPALSETKKITVFYDKIKTYTGLQIPETKALEILSSLGFSIERPKDAKDFVIVLPPEERAYDITALEDVIEEIVRVYGYEKLSSSSDYVEKQTLTEQQSYVASRSPSGSEIFKFENALRLTLKHSGFWEEVNYGMIPLRSDGGWFRFFDEKKCFVLANPISPEMAVLRPSLFCELWENFVSRKDGVFEHKLSFEVGNVFYDGKERRMLGIMAGGDLLSGDTVAGAAWKKSSLPVDFYFMKSVIEKIGQLVSRDIRLEFAPAFSNTNEKSEIAEDYMAFRINIYIAEKDESTRKIPIGIVGPASPRLALDSGIKHPVWWAEIDIEPLVVYKNSMPTTLFKPYPPYPPAIMDFSFFMPPSNPRLLIEEIEREIRSSILEVDEKLVIDAIFPIDIWQPPNDKNKTEQTPSDSKTSVTLRVALRWWEGTLDATRLRALHTRIIKQVLEEKFGLVMRASDIIDG